MIDLARRYELLLLIALGKPKGRVLLEECTSSDNIKYWRNENEVYHISKRELEDIILEL